MNEMSKASALISNANSWLEKAAAPAKGDPSQAKGEFANLLASELGRVFNAGGEVAGAIEDFNSGALGGSIEKTAFLMAKAEAELRLAVQVRNKAVSAYQDIMNMQI